MKFNIKYLMLSFLALTFFSCEEEPLVEYGSVSAEQRNDAYSDLLVNTPVIGFVGGVPDYAIEFLTITPNSDETSAIEVYSTFTDSKTGAVSESVLFKSYAVPAGQNTATFNDVITYADLKNGITVNGGPLPDNEVEVAIGSKWDLTFKPVNSSGEETFSVGSSINVGVGSPFAGEYEVIESGYFRIAVESGLSDFTGESRLIASVDDNTYAHVDAWGPFLPGDGASGEFYFDLADDNVITILDDPSQLFFSGDDMLTCQEDGGLFVSVPCDGSNVLIPSDDGAHIIKLTYGYFTASGDENEGAREFYEVLRKL